MSILKSLAFTAVSKDRNSPVQARRNQLVARLEEQKSLLADSAFSRIVRRWKVEDGQKVAAEHRVRVRAWWITDDKGQTVFTIKHGPKPVEFEKGKAGILVGSQDKLPQTIDTLIAAARTGELDAILEQAKGTRPAAKKKVG